MRTTFEDLTFELNEEESKIAEILAIKIMKNVGKEKVVTSNKIIDFFKKAGFKIEHSRCRKIIQYLRISGLVKCLVGCSKGYYIANTPEDAAKHILSLREQARAIQASANVLFSQAAERFGGDLVQAQITIAKKNTQS